MRRVAITGMGAVTAAGLGVTAMWEALLARRSLPAPHEFVAARGARMSLRASVVPEASLTPAMDPKSQWIITRGCAMSQLAARAAIEDAGLTPEAIAEIQPGIVFASSSAGLSPQMEFGRQTLRSDPRKLDLRLFPASLPVTPASQLAISLKVFDLNATLASGATSALDALNYAAHWIARGRGDMVIVGAVEELTADVAETYALEGLTTADRARPFDRRRSGAHPGEGAAVLVLEEREHARRRGARVHALWGGHGEAHAPAPRERVAAACTAMQGALARAGLPPEEIDGVFASASGSRTLDRIEARALQSAFRHGPPISAIKGHLGDAYSAAGALQIVAAIRGLCAQTLPGTCGFEEPDRSSLPLRVLRAPEELRLRAVLVNAFGRAGTHAAVTLMAEPS